MKQIKLSFYSFHRQKFLARIEQQPDLNRATQITLPRMSFEMTNIAYDATRKSSITT